MALFRRRGTACEPAAYAGLRDRSAAAKKRSVETSSGAYMTAISM